jgi:signal transduction histidine kinase
MTANVKVLENPPRKSQHPKAIPHRGLQILRSRIRVFVNSFRTTRALAATVETLNAEIAERERVQGELRSINEGLETRLLARTRDLERAQAEILESDRRKDEFLAALANDLRNPLAPIRYAVRILDFEGPMAADQRWAVRLIERQIQHLVRLIDDLEIRSPDAIAHRDAARTAGDGAEAMSSSSRCLRR